MNEYRRIVVSFLGVIVMIIVLSIGITGNHERLEALEQSALSMEDWTEGCYSYDTINRSKIIDPRGDGCWDICDVQFECEELDCGVSYCYHIAAATDSCTKCINATEPYIYRWQETSCVRTMLISSDVRII